ncbi:hypothetical protein F5Y10DRAFT_233273 [Nemania abortiva]|nr:hypothetical protein F5Y10DRAFT_233273 [Nemania abortiva]
MSVTELAWIPSATPGSIPPALIEAGRRGMWAQSEWAAKYAILSLPNGPPAVRGAGLYQQREDPGMALVTAHWLSPEQHAMCVASDENREAMEGIIPLSVVSEIKYFHVEGVLMFNKETLDAGLLSVMRIGVKAGEEDRKRVEHLWSQAKPTLSSYSKFEHTAGWRIEKEQGQEDRDEFVVVGAWRSENDLNSFMDEKSVNWEFWDRIWKPVMLDIDVKSYRRIA